MTSYPHPILVLVYCFLLILGSCKPEEQKKETLFTSLDSAYTNINFINKVENTQEMNIFNYRNFYNGGGVAIGDVNNDGLPDVYLTSNMSENQLYLNKGNFTFEDITNKAGVAGKQAWSTGVTMADVNGDGFLDIYVCNAGDVNGDSRKNELFIHNGLSKDGYPVFTEKAAEYGLDDEGFSTHAAFFDYDRDGDLDVYLLNNSSYPVSRLQYANLRNQRDELGGDKLLRNDNNTFTDVSEQAGMYGSLIGFGLGITIGDVNNDNWLDIYISNDFYERDYLYINNKNGTFTEESKEWMQHESLSSMGADIADINNDNNLDIFVTDMLPGDNYRLKTTSQFENYNLEQLKLARDFHYQYMQNMLHLNNGDGTFSEIARLANVHATDWSWGALIFDMDNDGLKDIFVANGIYKDLTDQDFVNFLDEEETVREAFERGGYKFNQELMNKMSSTPIPNYAFKNAGNFQFKNKAQDWGLGDPGFSNGAAYGDLDNDGDLDLIINNVNSPVSVYKNGSSEKLKTHYARVKLKGSGKNLHAIGAKVYLYQSGKSQFLQQMPNRGFESSIDLTLIFGLGNQPAIDSITVIWPDDKMQTLTNVKADQDIILEHANAGQTYVPKQQADQKIFTDVTNQVKLDYQHEENRFVDFDRDVLLKQMYSTQGPALATGDVNGDGLDDLFFGGARNKKSVLYTQKLDGSFQPLPSFVIAADSLSEDIDAVFFDADDDKDLDLYVVTGGNEFTVGDEQLLDHLYLNDGRGNFTKSAGLPAIAESGSCVAAADFDKDGDIDLFVGSRLIPGQYGYDPLHYLYVNDGTGTFKNMSKRYMPQIRELGMITAAAWADIDKDTYPDLIVAGDWAPVSIFKNVKGNRLDKMNSPALANSEGWWNTIHPADIDEDGDIDFILGNLGLNSRITASKEKPAALYVNDYDQNGSVEQIISCYTENGKTYPMVLKAELQKRLPLVKKKFVKFSEYADKGVADIFSPEQMKTVVEKKVYNPASSFLINEGNGKFTLEALPVEAQFSPIYGIETLDYDQDGKQDILLTGNFFDVLPEIGRYDANYGLILKSSGKGKFSVVFPRESGFFVKGQVRHARKIKGASNQEFIVLAKNNDKTQIFSYKKQPVQ
ncbi:VCBS repeat-containing protein [Rhodocytophaga rosea]|uniref:VCBS repeat-containing protein n=1 Tax=Rhodocytophaga rosea TaxID=2704465 RepID=A0A6C0GMS0_9BACT|nr:VCBS repeat-containing protein [Rhodocytophaga rosea]QHT68902.1 VCBS repeat-containing protein [Rhodocytophaga rosea]